MYYIQHTLNTLHSIMYHVHCIYTVQCTIYVVYQTITITITITQNISDEADVIRIEHSIYSRDVIC